MNQTRVKDGTVEMQVMVNGVYEWRETTACPVLRRGEALHELPDGTCFITHE